MPLPSNGSKGSEVDVEVDDHKVINRRPHQRLEAYGCRGTLRRVENDMSTAAVRNRETRRSLKLFQWPALAVKRDSQDDINGRAGGGGGLHNGKR